MVLTNDWCIRGGARRYVVTKSFIWHIGKKGSRWEVTVPEGFEFESSVPRYLWWLFSPDNSYFLKAAAVHDFLLEVEQVRPAFAAGEWHDAARSVHAPSFRRITAFIAVSIWTITGRSYGDRQ